MAPVVNVVKLFRGNLDFPKIKKLKKSLFWCLNLHKNIKTKQFLAKIYSKRVYFLKWAILSGSAEGEI